VTGNTTNYENSQGDNPICSTRDEISQPSRPISPRAATGGRFRLLVKRTAANFDGEIWKPHLSHHFSTLGKDCWHKSFSCVMHDPLSEKEKSSAYSEVRDLMPSGRSFMRMKTGLGLKYFLGECHWQDILLVRE